MKIRSIALLTVLGLALGVAPAVAGNGEGGEKRNARALGAPGWACKQENLTPGTPEFRACVQAKAQARRQAIAAARREANAALKAAVAACRQQYGPGTAERRDCVRGVKQAARTARQERRQALKAAIGQCRQTTEPGTQAFRDCVKAAKTAAKEAQLQRR